MKFSEQLIVFSVTSSFSLPLLAGDLNSPAAPSDAGSAMYTIEDIYNRLDAGTEGTKRTTFKEPSAGPASTGKNLDDVMGQAPVVDNTDGAATTDVKTGKKFWGLKSSEWGLQTGTSTAVDTSTGDATAADIASGKKAWVDGNEITGTGTIASYSAPVAKTGESSSTGVAWPNPRFTINTTADNNSDGDCDDEGETCAGTVTDNLTGLIWLQNANCKELPGVDTTTGEADWETAKTAASGLTGGKCGLPGEFKADNWRLPNVQELQSLISYGYKSPALSNTTGTGQWVEGDAFLGVQTNYYWSSTPYAADTNFAWSVYFDDGFVYFEDETNTYYVWPLRGGE